ncbi:MAG TPA: putative baseplate assembly protein [Jatrophihabitans sp.]|nr:putative baseplate assembly protein [Jatrophihabitans sp.]
MALPVPNLDDRRFQDLVDDAKRLVQRRCPEWTDHNVSDPGVTLIETFAFMTDQLLFRLNQVPDRMYVKFLEMIGLRMLAATPARAPVTFWLSAPAVASVGIPAGTSVATPRTESEESIVFSTRDDLQIVPCMLQDVATQSEGETEVSLRTEGLKLAQAFRAFSEVPVVGETLLVGLNEPVPHCVVRIDVDATVEGVGVHPDHPPLAWEAWTGSEWTQCRVSSDSTLALNTSGRVLVHVPERHDASIIDGTRAGWLRARVIDVPEDFPKYSASPVIRSLAACTVGGTVDAIHAEIIDGELLGESDGVPGQEFPVSHNPILAGAGAPVLETMSDDGWVAWEQVEHFADSGPDDRHFILDAVAGFVRFGPAIRDEDGGMRQHGAMPPRGMGIRLRGHAVGGGRRGNVSKGAIRALKSSIPFVSSVENLESAQGGVDGETIAQAKARGPILLRTRSRAVTAEDYEAITLEAAPELARVECVTAGEDEVAAGSLRVLVVPAAPEEAGRIEFAELVPAEDTLERIAERLDEVRLIGTRVSVEPPSYRGVTVVARIVARPKADVERIQKEALDALYGYLNPISGGPDGDGWPFGRPVQSGEVYGLLQRIRGVDMVEDARLFGANPVTGERGKETRKLELDPYSLLFSYEHQVRVEQH